MRFDEFVQATGVEVVPVERFAGFVVEVGVPPSWEPFESGIGIWLWVWRNGPRCDVFCANAALTTHRVEAALDAREVFDMLAEQQLQSIPGCQERSRMVKDATEGPGVVGSLMMQIADALGTVDSVTQSRIVTIGQETLIAQLTVTALLDSWVDISRIWLTLRPGTALNPKSITSRRGGAPVGGMRDGR